jgi:hypothetical protein
MECEPQGIDGIPALPIQTLEALDTLETVLNQSDHKSRFVSSEYYSKWANILKCTLFIIQGQQLAICGGANVTSAMKNIGAKLISEELTIKFNYTGTKGKLNFERFKNICGCVAGN